MILCVSGPPGVGKSTIQCHLQEAKDWNVLPTYTTRALRHGESEKISISQQRFDAMVAEDEFFSSETFYGAKYGVTHRDVALADTADTIRTIDRPIWALSPFSSQRIGLVIVLPESEQQLRCQLLGRKSPERINVAVREFRQHYRRFLHDHDFGPRVFFFRNRPGFHDFFSQTKSLIKWATDLQRMDIEQLEIGRWR